MKIAAAKDPEKSRLSKIAAKKNPWLNYLHEFREKNKQNSEYQGPGHKKLFSDASALFKALSSDEKDQYRVIRQAVKEVQEGEQSATATTEAKKGRAKK